MSIARGLRFLIFLVALTGVLIWAASHFADLRMMIASHRSMANYHAARRQAAERAPKYIDDPAVREWSVRAIRYHQDWERQYLNAAAWPWVKVPPEPDEPTMPLP